MYDVAKDIWIYFAWFVIRI